MKVITILFLAFICAGVYFSSGLMPSESGAQDLTEIKVYPNPFKPKLGHTKITFENLKAGSAIRIYSCTGKLIWEKQYTTASKEFWYADNTSSQKVAAGIYTYVIIAPDGVRTVGKVAIAR